MDLGNGSFSLKSRMGRLTALVVDVPHGMFILSHICLVLGNFCNLWIIIFHKGREDYADKMTDYVDCDWNHIHLFIHILEAAKLIHKHKLSKLGNEINLFYCISKSNVCTYMSAVMSGKDYCSMFSNSLTKLGLPNKQKNL